MSCFPLKKKHLLPSSNKGWRRFTSKLQSKLQKLKKSNTPYQNQNKREFQARKLRRQRSFAPVYVDELLQQPAPTVVEHVEPKMQGKKVVEINEASSLYNSMMVDGGLGEVDVRAEMFIAKFREDMRLQRQRSLEKYREMLARGL